MNKVANISLTTGTTLTLGLLGLGGTGPFANGVGAG